MVAPLVGAWIEIVVSFIYSVATSVAPLVGAWIEIEPGINMETRDGSLPSWERGLKSLISLFKIPLTMSLPSWERGLKLLYNYPVVRQTIVAPLVGAWIEIVPVS